MQSEISRLFSGFTPTTRDFPPINIWLGDSSVVVTSELPGVTRGDVTINLRDDALTLEAARREGCRMPIGNGNSALTAVSRTVQLPFRVDADKVRARFNSGSVSVTETRIGLIKRG